MAKVAALPDPRRALVARIHAEIMAAIHARETDEDAPVYHPTMKDPKDVGAPMTLRPPVEGARDHAAARVIGRWIFSATPKLRMRGLRMRYTGDGWHG